MEKQINTYQGMNKDTAYDTIASTLYIDALDIRITTTTGESTGAFTNIKGNEYAFSIPNEGIEDAPFSPWLADSPEIIGYATIRNRIILFVADTSDTKGWIYDLQYDPYTKQILPGNPTLIYYNEFLYFKKAWPIEALGRYESDCTQRVYWTDYNNFFRALNIADPNLVNYPVGNVDIFPDIIYTQVLLKFIGGGGALMGGEYQVSFKLITSDGKETLIAPPGNLIHIVADTETTGTAGYNGDLVPETTNTGKSFTVTVDTSAYGDFEKIEFIVAYYASTTASPVAQSIGQVTINNQASIDFTYTGTGGSIIPIELLTFTTKNFAFKTPKTITPKDNALVVANIKGSTIRISDLITFPETFDAKTERYDSGINLPSGDILTNAFNSDYNSDAHWNEDWHNNSQFKYQSDGVTLGGQGANISYKFHLEPFSLDGDIQPGFANLAPVPFGFPYDFHDLNDGYGAYNNTTYANHASPFISGLLRGYKRGETYRFGIVFYTLKGEASFVEYIGDIKFPDISEEDSNSNASGTNYWPLSQRSTLDSRITIGYSMGIEFTIDFTSCPSLLNNISGYQIVRVKREEVDKRRLSQGIIKTFWINPVGPEDSGSGFNLQVDSSENVLHVMPQYQGLGLNPQTLQTIGDHQFNTTIGGDTYTNALPYVAGTIASGYWIKSQYLGFYSPDISFNTNNVRTIGTNLSNTPCLLMTGAYTTEGPSVYYVQKNLTNVDLPRLTTDIRNKRMTVVPVTYNSIENIKKLDHALVIDMNDTCDYSATVTGDWGGYYLRNYWAIDAYQGGVSGTNLNDPQGGAGGASNYPEFSKSGTSLINKTSKITNDIFTGAGITSSVADFFITSSNVFKNGSPYSKITGLLGAGTDVFPIIDLVTPKLQVYGGNTINALQANTFIGASPFINVNNVSSNTHTFRIFGGDTFLNMFTLDTSHVEFKKEFFPENASNNPKYYAQTTSRTELYVMESNVNIDLANGATLKTLVEYKFTSGSNTEEQPILRQETNNSLAPDAKTLKMYNYDMVYSIENTAVTFFTDPNPEQDADCNVNDIRTYLSSTKVNDEKIDSWTKFGVNNFYDIDDYGPINKIINYKDIVHFLQDRAVGVYAINRAAITTTADGTPTGLGTGQGFGKHQYFSKVHGSMHQWAVKTTENGIYFFDALSRKIFMLQSSGEQAGNNPLSEVKGIHSWLQALPSQVFVRKEDGGDNPILRKGVHLGKDLINDEVIFTFLSEEGPLQLLPNTSYAQYSIILIGGVYYIVQTPFTTGEDQGENFKLLLENSAIVTKPSFETTYASLVYDELMQQFSCFYSATPKIWIDNTDTLISQDVDNPEDIYVHNIGEWGVFYDNQVECSLTLVINPQADINKVLRTVEFNSIVRDDAKVIDRAVTITAFQITTQYQDTGKVPYSSDRIKRKFDKWRVKIPRDTNTNNQQGRLRSTYFVLTLFFDNSNNQEIIVNRLMSYFDYQIF